MSFAGTRVILSLKVPVEFMYRLVFLDGVLQAK
jgi:hypothetical protein